jgi:hypothetical protein
MFVMSTDNSKFYNNRLENNNSFGIALASLYQAFSPDKIGDSVGVYCENNRIYDNTYLNNGTAVDEGVKAAGLPGADVLWDTTGYGNIFDDKDANMFPPALPDSTTPDFMQRLLFNLWSTLSKLL